MAGASITKQVAALALKKLAAKEVSGRQMAHPEYVIYYDGKLQARTNLRHGSNRDASCEHIKRDLRISAPFVLELARCTKYLVDWAKEVGLATAEQAETDRIQRADERKARMLQRCEALGSAGYAGDYSKIESMPDVEFDQLFAAAQKAKLEREREPPPS